MNGEKIKGKKMKINENKFESTTIGNIYCVRLL